MKTNATAIKARIIETFRHINEDFCEPKSSLIQDSARALGIDRFWLSRFTPWEVMIQQKFEPSFDIDTEVTISLTCANGIGHYVKTKWPSGGGDSSVAVAAAAQHLEKATKAARADAILKRLVFALRGEDKEQVAEAFKMLNEESIEHMRSIGTSLQD